MDTIQRTNERLAIINVIVGFILGIYLGIGHDNPNLWFDVVQWIVLISFILAFISTLVGVYAKLGDDAAEFNISSPIRVFVLNLAMVAVSTSFGFIFTSIAIGNFSTAN